VSVLTDRDPERRMVLAIAAPLDDLTRSGNAFRARLGEMSRDIAVLMTNETKAETKVALRPLPEPRAMPVNRT
jgi:hypothetical protein